MDQPTQTTCWKCGKNFHIVIKQQDYVSSNLVTKLIPCPYCNTLCKVVIHEDQVSCVRVFRGGNSETSGNVPFGDLLSRGALADRVFMSIQPDEQK